VSIADEIREQGFDAGSAQRYAREGGIEEWVHRYCNAGPWANPGLSQGLKLQRRWWDGPVEMKLTDLHRAVGPEPGMEYSVDADNWAAWTSAMAASMESLSSIPPLIAEYRDGVLSLRDGNTRHGAMSRLGWETCWVIVWYNAEEDYRRHGETLT
jgi:hypothetical protein